jgi:hypothetical protein
MPTTTPNRKKICSILATARGTIISLYDTHLPQFLLGKRLLDSRSPPQISGTGASARAARLVGGSDSWSPLPLSANTNGSSARPRAGLAWPCQPAARPCSGPPARALLARAGVVSPDLGVRDHPRLASRALGSEATTLASRAHRRPPRNEATATPASTSAALAADLHIGSRSRVVTTGSGLPRRRRRAPPVTPVFGPETANWCTMPFENRLSSGRPIPGSSVAAGIARE